MFIAIVLFGQLICMGTVLLLFAFSSSFFFLISFRLEMLLGQKMKFLQ